MELTEYLIMRDFLQKTDNNILIPAPADVLDAIPLYVVSECLKIDDEAKSAIRRNEFEMFLASFR